MPQQLVSLKNVIVQCYYLYLYIITKNKLVLPVVKSAAGCPRQNFNINMAIPVF